MASNMVAALDGRINDLDSHEMVPPNLWADTFGPAAGRAAQLILPMDERTATTQLAVRVDGDVLPITDDVIWRRVGWTRECSRAPGAIDLKRRLEVLNLMGVRCQQIFPTLGLFGLVLTSASPARLAWMYAIPERAGISLAEARDLGRAMIREYNSWAIDKTGIDRERFRITAVIPTEDLAAMIEEAERVIAGGVRALFIPSSVPPGGFSPADRAIAPFWTLCEEANASVALHVASEQFLATDEWGLIPEFGRDVPKGEFSEFVADPFHFGTCHYPVENFLSALILGGVFERHPTLRFGAFEFGAHWVGPLGDNLDTWATVFRRRMERTLSEKPSTYMRRNVRVAPFSFEPVDRYLDRFNDFGLEEILAYASDYPHFEGGEDQVRLFAGKLARHGSTVVEKFFVTNAEHLLGRTRDTEGRGE